MCNSKEAKFATIHFMYFCPYCLGLCWYNCLFWLARNHGILGLGFGCLVHVYWTGGFVGVQDSFAFLRKCVGSWLFSVCDHTAGSERVTREVFFRHQEILGRNGQDARDLVKDVTIREEGNSFLHFSFRILMTASLEPCAAIIFWVSNCRAELLRKES